MRHVECVWLRELSVAVRAEHFERTLDICWKAPSREGTSDLKTPGECVHSVTTETRQKCAFKNNRVFFFPSVGPNHTRLNFVPVKDLIS